MKLIREKRAVSEQIVSLSEVHVARLKNNGKPRKQQECARVSRVFGHWRSLTNVLLHMLEIQFDRRACEWAFYLETMTGLLHLRMHIHDLFPVLSHVPTH